MLRTRITALLAKVETTEGTDAAPLPSLDAVLVENLKVKTETASEETNESTGSLDSSAPIPGGTKAHVTFDVFLKGSGVAGIPPEWGKLLRACGIAEIATAAAIPAAPEAVVSGSTSTAVLGASAAAAAQLYRGMPLSITGTPSAAVGIHLIADYATGKTATLADAAGAAIAATSLWQILPNVVYVPVSADPPSLTLYAFKDKKRTRVTGARGTASVKLVAGKVCRISFDLVGMFLDETDTPVPAGLTYDSTRPPTWRDGRALLNRHVAAMASLSLQLGNKTPNPDDPNAKEGFGPAIITSRSVTGSCDPVEELVATRDTVALMRAGTPQVILAQYGSDVGNRVALTIPAAQYTARDSGDRDGVATENLNFKCVGLDSGFFLALF